MEQTIDNPGPRLRRRTPSSRRPPAHKPAGPFPEGAPRRHFRPWTAIPAILIVLVILIGTLLIGRSPGLFNSNQFAAGTLDATPTATVEITAPEPPSEPVANPSGSRGGSTRAGVMPGPAPSGVPSLAWTRPDVRATIEGLTTDGDRLYVTRSNADESTFSMVAIDLASGADLWSVEVENGSWFVPVTNDDFVFFPRTSSSTASGELLALDRNDGSVAWSYPVDGWIGGASPALADGLLFLTLGDSTLRAVDAETGAEVWRAELYVEIPQPGEGPGEASVAVGNGTVFAAGPNGKLFAFDAEDGSPRWSYQAEGWINRSPVVSDGVIFVSSLVLEEGPAGTPGRLSALDARTGEPVWETKFIGSSFSLTAAEGTLFVVGSTPDGSPLEAYDARTGESLWSYPGAGFMFAPVVVDGTVFVAREDGAIVGLDTATGDMTWSVYLGWVSEPVLVDGLLVAGSYNGLVAVEGDGGANSPETVDLSGLPACEPPRAYPRAEIEGTPAATIEQETRLEEREGRPPTWEDGRPAQFVEFPQLLIGNLPGGSEAPIDDVAAIQETIERMRKCGARPEGDLLRQGFYTDDFFRRGYVPFGESGYRTFWTLSESPTESFDFVLLDDGRIATIWSSSGTPRDLLIFAEEDGDWLIDESYNVVSEYNFGPLG